MRRRSLGLSALALALGLVAVADGAGTSTTLDFVTFDGIDYVRFIDEPGRELTRADLGVEFGTVGCSIGEDSRACSYGVDAGAAFMPAGTRMYAVRGYATEFRLAAAWRDRLFLYQAWRNPRARVGRDLFDIAGRVRGDRRAAPRRAAARGDEARAGRLGPGRRGARRDDARRIDAPSDPARRRRAGVLAHDLARRWHHARPALLCATPAS